MNHKKQIGRQIIALLLFTILVLPIGVQSLHVLEEHEHPSCNDKTTHIHESISECELCAVHFSSVKYDIDKYPSLLLPTIFVKVSTVFDSLRLHSFTITNTQLRAPPVFS